MVVFYHAFPRVFTGGFAGVDVFFVISGYLITEIIINNINRKVFTLSGFFKRRVNRIYPPLLVLLISILFFGWFFLLSDEYEQLSEYVISSSIFLTNFLVLNQISYFDNAAETKPLINLWSLAVEEQFYIFWPLILLFLNRIRKKPLNLMIALALLSFLANIFFGEDNKDLIFFQPQFRAWEFLAGGIVFAMRYDSRCNRFASLSESKKEFLGFFSIVILLVCAFSIDSTTMIYPGWVAAFPVLATATLIFIGNSSFVNKKLLSCKPMVYVGLISYPLYLFHWPILSVPRVLLGNHLPTKLVALLLCLSFAFASMVYHFVEIPLKKNHSKNKAFFLILTMFTVSICSLIIFFMDGVKNRQAALNGEKLTIAKKDWDYKPTSYVNDRIVGIHELSGKSDKKILFAGSSLVGQYYPRVKYLYSNDVLPYYSVLYASRDHCTPYPGDNSKTYPENISCVDYYNSIIKTAVDDPSINKIVLGGKWPRLTDNDSLSSDGMKFVNDLLYLKSKNKEVFLLTNPPMYKFYAGLRAVLQNDTNLSVNSIDLEDHKTLDGLRIVSDLSGAQLINVMDYLCEGGQCQIVKNGVPNYSDASHITATFAAENAKFIDFILNTK